MSDMIHINYESDFKILQTLNSSLPVDNAPFEITFYVPGKEGKVVASFDGTNYTNCRKEGDGVVVAVDAGTLGTGKVRCTAKYSLTDADFKDGVYHAVTDYEVGIELWRGASDDMGEVLPLVLPGYQKGEKGDKGDRGAQGAQGPQGPQGIQGEKGDSLKYSDLTDEQKEDLAYQVIGEAESERRAAEIVRQENETKRVDAETLRQEAEAIREATYKNKVDRDDNAPKLTAGFANNLVGRGEATSEEIGFRPSGGDTSIEDGTARIERIKGNTVVWNQRRRDTQIGADRDGIKTSYDSMTGLITIENVSRDTACITGSTQILLGYIPDGHEVYVSTDKIEEGVVVTDLSAYVAVGKIGALNGSKGIYLRITYAYDFVTKHPIGDKFTLRMNLYDLTQMFGAGNEPTTIEEFNARKPLGIDEYAYNEGELISTNVDEVKSVGFNAFNGEYAKVLGGNQYELVGTYSSIGFSEEIGGELTNIEIPSDKLYTPDKDGYIYAQGADICIHLSHTGYRNGEYEPYKEFRRSIPISEIKDSDGNQLFPNGLLSAGRVYDEITATKAIKRIGVLDMGTQGWAQPEVSRFTARISDMTMSTGKLKANVLIPLYTATTIDANRGGLDKSIAYNAGYISIVDTAYTDAATFKAAMSGVMLYYELAEPIEVDLPESLNLDYEVSDFGTEEVISDVPTTPMKADIIYQFNAVDRIRDNSRHTAEADKKLADYETRIAALEAIVTSLTSSEV